MDRIGVVGAGTMGHGITHVCAAAGLSVRLYDAVAGGAARGLAKIRSNLDKGVERGKVTAADRDAALGRITLVATLTEVAEAADLVIEAVPESMALKHEVFRTLEADAPARAILASNTSSLPIGAIAAPLADPGRVVGLHFFNPVHLMPLLEIVVTPHTRDEVLAAAIAFGARIGKETIVVRDAPGFATSRLGVCLGMEAIRMVEQGVATPEDIDKAMVLGYRHPVGPLRLTDLVGLDVRMAIGQHLAEALGNPAFAPPELMRRMVAEGRLGAKSGRGFYDWPSDRTA